VTSPVLALVFPGQGSQEVGMGRDAYAASRAARDVFDAADDALSFGLSKDKKGKIAVFDLGGGTFDISILEVADGVFKVESTNGDTHLGGDDFDQVLIDWVAGEFQRENGIDLRKDPMALQRLREAAEKAKQELSTTMETEINLPFVTADASGPKHLNVSLTRERFEALVADLIAKLVEPCETALADAGLRREDVNEVILVGGMTRMPRVREKVAEIFARKPQAGVNPDEVVAIGAAIQGGVLKGEVEDVLLLDVNPLSLGVETQGGVATKIIDKNTTIPTKKSQVFSTTEDNQTVVRIHVLQGEREMAADNKSLGRFELVGVPPAPRGVPQIEVTFEIDTDGVVSVSAKDLGTGKTQAIRVTASGGLSADEVERLVREAEQNSDADKSRRQLADLRNKADGLVYSTERTLEEYGQHVPEAEQRTLREKIEKTRAALAAADLAALASAVDELSALSYQMTEGLYAKLGGESAG